MNKNYILGIEASCDETAAAVYHQEHGLLSNEVFSQIPIHQKKGGIIPEVASRQQLEKIEIIVSAAINNAHISLHDIDAIAVTNRPGLPGSLLVGLCFAKSLALVVNKPIIGINHLEGHTFSAFLENQVPFPHLCITASGGHTSLNLVLGFGNYTTLADTRDDAAGEAFDKIARLLGLTYPGGPLLERLAREIHFIDYYQYPRGNKRIGLDFSFSGLKTAVLYDLVKKGAYDLHKKVFLCPENTDLIKKVASSLHVCIADIFVEILERSLSTYPEVKAITFVGGVACNSYIASRIKECAQGHSLPSFVPSARFCTDNAAMIAFVGAYKIKKYETHTLDLDIFQCDSNEK